MEPSETSEIYISRLKVGVWVVSASWLLFLQLIEHQHPCVHFLKAIDPHILVNYCRCLRSFPRLFSTRTSLLEVVGCLVSPARVDDRQHAPMTPVEPALIKFKQIRQMLQEPIHIAHSADLMRIAWAQRTVQAF